MSLPLDLLEQAEHLATREPKRPRQASLRRSVSTAYYAVFHLLVIDATAICGPNIFNTSRERMARWFDHGEMKRACNFFAAGADPNHTKAPRQLAYILDAPISTELQLVAKAFIRLQEGRHDADYNLSKSWTRLTAEQYLNIAKHAFAAWTNIKKTHEANVFALALLSSKLFDKER